jgi:hypothetical protein
MGFDQLNLVNPAGGAGPDPSQLIQMLRDPNPNVRFQAIQMAVQMAQSGQAAQALPVLQTAAANDNPQVVGLAQRALPLVQQMVAGAQPNQQQPPQQQFPGQQPTQFPGQQQQPTQTTFQPAVTQPQQAPVMGPGTAYVPNQPTQLTYQAPNMGQLNPQDAEFMMQSLQSDLQQGGDPATRAIQQLAGLAQASPALKDKVYALLLNHLYYHHDGSTTEAIKVLGSMNNPAVLPYMQAVQRDPGYTTESHNAALAVIQAMATSNPGGPGTASVDGGAQGVTYIRAMEYELGKGGAPGMAAFQQIRNALGPDPRAQSPARAEVVRVMLSHIATKSDPDTVTAACQLLGAMGAREMDTLRYLDAVKRNPGQSTQARNAAAAAIQQILTTPAH